MYWINFFNHRFHSNYYSCSSLFKWAKSENEVFKTLLMKVNLVLMMCWVALLNMCLPGWLYPSSPWWVLESDHCCLSTQSEWRWPQPPTGPAPSTLLWWSPRPGLCCSSPGWKWAHVQHNTEETLIYWELSFYRRDNIISHSLRISCVLHQYSRVIFKCIIVRC